MRPMRRALITLEPLVRLCLGAADEIHAICPAHRTSRVVLQLTPAR